MPVPKGTQSEQSVRHERGVLADVLGRLQVSPQDVVVLETNLSAKHPRFVPENPSTWKSRRYFFKRYEAIYQIDLDLENDGKSAKGELVEFPTEEMSVRFAALAARKAKAGGQRTILPIDHPDYVEEESPVYRGPLEKVSINDRHVPGDAMGDPELNPGESVDGEKTAGEVAYEPPAPVVGNTSQ